MTGHWAPTLEVKNVILNPNCLVTDGREKSNLVQVEQKLALGLGRATPTFTIPVALSLMTAENPICR